MHDIQRYRKCDIIHGRPWQGCKKYIKIHGIQYSRDAESAVKYTGAYVRDDTWYDIAGMQKVR